MSFLPASRITHWTFRLFDYIRIQILLLLLALLIASLFLFDEKGTLIVLSQLALLIAIVYEVAIITPYLPYNKFSKRQHKEGVETSIISVNVLQKNKNYDQLVALIKKEQPDILLTMETNKAWELALKKIEIDYPFRHKIPKENRYGMHFYSKLKVSDVKEHYLISDERPAIEVHLEDSAGNNFIFWGIHPPPPSPTEKPTAKQKDAELVLAAKLIRERKEPSIIVGDFNNVAWSRSAKIFAKISTLKDARLANGIYGTFPAKRPVFRIPIDLLFSSKEIEIHEIKTLSDIGSDHLPIFSKFTVTNSNSSKTNNMSADLEEKADSIVEEGKEAVIEEE